MPELPEVETVRRGILPYLEGERITSVQIRNPNLRWPIPADLPEQLTGYFITAVDRRGKYLLLRSSKGSVIIHLGMSGHLRVISTNMQSNKHDHFEIMLESGYRLVFNDPRRFGAILWVVDDPLLHPLLAELGPEPLSRSFTGDYLFKQSREKRLTVKQFLMNNHHVVGIGNIYANEALFHAAIRPDLPVGKLSRNRCRLLVKAIQKTLKEAIAMGGTSLHDFIDSAGKPGYFQTRLAVYGRSGKPCLHCGTIINLTRLGGRSTYRCRNCQQ